MTLLMSETHADDFVTNWLDAWNAHDLDRITAHYHDDVEYYSPFVARLSTRLSKEQDHLRGKEAVRDYVASALERFPDLELGPVISVAPGAGSVAAVYRSVEGLLAIETLVLDEGGLVIRAHCHYRAPA
jgi:ketosteroid isomerase-like protein